MLHACEECGGHSGSDDIWFWCASCNAQHFRQQFNSWTSGNSVIDKFIQETQLTAFDHFQKLEWIPYELFTDVTYLSRGGFGKVYKATWKQGYIYKWDVEKKDWSRRGGLLGAMKVVLKCLYNSKEIYSEFFDEIKSQLSTIMVKRGYRVIPCYGITKDPESGDFMMVMRFAEEGSLRQYLDKNFHSLDWYQKFKILYTTLRGLEDIHNAGFTHRDFHGGNVVMFDFEDACITDFGLCKPITHDSSKEAQKVIGSLPYVAPEVLRKCEYKQPADIYSFGILMNEVATGLPPYKDLPHDSTLALSICQGFRPKIVPEITPQLFIQLTERCWDTNPANRPTAQELAYQLGKWFGVYDSEEYDEFWNQIKEIEQGQMINLNPSKPEIIYQTHPQAFYTSRLLSFSIPSQSQSQSQSRSHSLNLGSGSRVFDSSLIDLELPEIPDI